MLGGDGGQREARFAEIGRPETRAFASPASSGEARAEPGRETLSPARYAGVEGRGCAAASVAIEGAATLGGKKEATIGGKFRAKSAAADLGRFQPPGRAKGAPVRSERARARAR